MALATVDFLQMQIEEAEKHLTVLMRATVESDLLRTLPYVGPILSMVMSLEIGTVDRFPSSAHLASYAGLVPRVHSSGGHTRLGQVCGDVNRYLKWAFVEAGNLIVAHQRHLAGRHVVRSLPARQTQEESPKGRGRGGSPFGRGGILGIKTGRRHIGIRGRTGQNRPVTRLPITHSSTQG